MLSIEEKEENETRWLTKADGTLPPQYEGDKFIRFEMASQLYAGNHCRFSSGIVENPDHAPDVIYLIIERGHPSDESYERTEKHIRPDEAAAIAHILSGSLFSWSYERIADGKDGE